MYAVIHNVHLLPPCNSLANGQIGKLERHHSEAAGYCVQPVGVEEVHNRDALCHERIVHLAP